MRTETSERTDTVSGERRAHATRTVITVTVVSVVLLAAAVIGLVVAMQDRGSEDGAKPPAAASTEPSAPAPSTTDAGAGGGTATTEPPRTSPAAGPVLADGRHPVFLTDINVARRSAQFDLIQFLTGDEAVAAYHKDYPDQSGRPPNNYYIVDDNPQLRRLPVADDVAVGVLNWNDLARPLVIAFADLPTYLAGHGTLDGGQYLGSNPFWLTVHNGTVTAIEEQYLP